MTEIARVPAERMSVCELRELFAHVQGEGAQPFGDELALELGRPEAVACTTQEPGYPWYGNFLLQLCSDSEVVKFTRLKPDRRQGFLIDRFQQEPGRVGGDVLRIGSRALILCPQTLDATINRTLPVTSIRYI